jgi:hypothetical protein
MSRQGRDRHVRPKPTSFSQLRPSFSPGRTLQSALTIIHNPDATMSDQTQPKRRGCFFYGCLITGILLVLGLLAAYLGTRYVIRKVVNYTDAAPMALPATAATPAQVAATQQRWDAFVKDVKAGKATAPLALNTTDLNALIAGSGSANLKDSVRVTIEGDQLKGQVSLPLDQFKIGLLRGRYLNGTMAVKLGLRDGRLAVHAESVQTSRGPLPAAIMDKLRQENLAEQAMQDPDTAKALAELESIEVSDGKLIITPRSTR